MHLSSLKNMEKFFDGFYSSKKESELKIVDLGSTEMGACYRPLINNTKWKYIGVDLSAGPNVDLVLKRPYHWNEIESSSVDILISGQVLEHVEYFWITALEISRVLKAGGMACLIAPSAGPEHRYPVDCWRFYPDGMRSIAKFARLECLEVHTDWENSGDPGSDLWHDTVLVVRKPRRSFIKAALISLLQRIQHRLLTVGLIQTQ